jgi:hypothetical protein
MVNDCGRSLSAGLFLPALASGPLFKASAGLMQFGLQQNLGHICIRAGARLPRHIPEQPELIAIKSRVRAQQIQAAQYLFVTAIHLQQLFVSRERCARSCPVLFPH